MNVSTVQTAKISRKHTTSKRQEKQYEGFLPGDRKLFFQHMSVLINYACVLLKTAFKIDCIL